MNVTPAARQSEAIVRAVWSIARAGASFIRS
jgi:hypothetical protein